MFVLRELMNFDSFWSLWFWITHAVAWSMASHFTMGVPYDMVVQANREKTEDGPWQHAAEALINAQIFRFTAIWRRYQLPVTGVLAFLLTALATLGTLGQLEFARALLTLLLPLTLIYMLTTRKALKLERLRLSGAALRQAIRRQRLINQLIGLMGIVMATILAIYQAVLNIQVLYW